MALKPDRNMILDSIAYFMNETGTRGGIVMGVTGTSVNGPGLDNADRRATYLANPSGQTPLGVLMTDVVNIDLSRQHLNPYKNEAQVGDKVTIIRNGTVVTNSIMAGQASGLNMPATAYVGDNGNLCTSAGYNTASGYPTVGQFLTNVDADGYAELRVNL